MDLSRQIRFIGEKAQEKLSNSTIAIAGCGALGSNSAELLIRAGIQKLILVDFDIVDASNLQRQALYTQKDINTLKVEALKKHLLEINPKIKVETYSEKLIENNLKILKSDLIIDGTDNLKIRFLINKYAKENNISYVFGSSIRSEGMVYSITKNKPCFECIFLKSKDFENCENQGVLASTVKITSSIQCTEAIKILIGEKSNPNLIKFDIWNNDFNSIKVKKRDSCTVCNFKKENLNEKKVDFEIIDCETKAMYRVKLKKRARLDMSKLEKYKTLIDGGMIKIINTNCGEVIVHNYGELIFKTCKDTNNIRKISQEIFNDAIQR